MATRKSNRGGSGKITSDAPLTTDAAGTTNTPARELTDLQALVCDLAADLILNGGAHEDVTALLSGVVRHSYRAQFRDIGDVPTAIERDQERWLRDLMRAWPEAKKSPKENPGTVSGQLRASVRSDLRSRFRSFLGNGRMHELFLLSDVLMTFESINRGPTSDEAESLLAEAFTAALGANHTYVKVPRKHIQRVEDFVALLNPSSESDEAVSEEDEA